jgi:hypothetical protein
MSTAALEILDAVRKLDESAQREIAHEILVRLGDESPVLSEEQKDILRAEIAAHRANPESSSTWQEVRARILAVA